MVLKKIIIWGAGGIGRGFIGDLFFAKGYELVFVDNEQALIDGLKKNNTYNVVRAHSVDQVESVEIKNFSIYHTSEKEEIQKEIDLVNLIILAVYPQNYQMITKDLQEFIFKRQNTRGNDPIDILLCTNLTHAGQKFKKFLLGGISDDERCWIEEHVGIIESLVLRLCKKPPKDYSDDNPFAVWTNGYPVLFVDKHAFKGTTPADVAFQYIDNMRAAEIRKIYTYNMCHAVISYYGHIAGYTEIFECLADPIIKAEAEGALKEISLALQTEYGFSKDEMDTWIDDVILQTNNPTVADTVFRAAADPLRKLMRDDRLIGPIQLCIQNGIFPKHIIKAVAAAFHYYDEDDSASVILQEKIKEKGIVETIKTISGLSEKDAYLLNHIQKAYTDLRKVVPWDERAAKAYSLGFEYEKVFHGCGQCTMAAISETLGIFNEEVFASATGLCGGVGLITENTCSAFTGGVMAIGMVYRRHRCNFDGNRETKYLNFTLAQKLHTRFIEKYGSTICKNIHASKYSRTYDLRLPEELKVFDDNGGHGDQGCSEVVGDASKWVIEIIAEEIHNQIKQLK